MKSVLNTNRYPEERLDSICFKFIVIDVLFLPLFPLFSVSMSLPIMAYWYLFRGKSTHGAAEYKLFPYVVVMMVLSTILGALVQWEVRWETTFETSVKRFFQFYTSFWYFLFFKYYFVKYDKKLSPYIFWFVVYVAFIGVYYTMFKDQFIHYKSIINPADPHTRRFLEGTLFGIYRYTFLWADANNVAYAIGGTALFYFAEEHANYSRKYIILCLIVFILLCTMSLGGMVVAVSLLAISFFFTDAFMTKGRGVFVSIVSIGLVAAILVYYGDVIMTTFEEGAGTRLESYGDDQDMSGGRMRDFFRTIPLMSPIFAFIGSGLEGFTSENGHLYLISLYGFPVYAYFIYVLFWKRKHIKISRYLSIVPFFVGFTMNIAIIDQKYLLILLLLNAYLSAEDVKLQKHTK